MGWKLNDSNRHHPNCNRDLLGVSRVDGAERKQAEKIEERT